MEVIMPQLGLFFWTLVIFLTIFFLLSKFAWKPILKSIHEREESIASALQAAEAAKNEMARLTGENEKILNEARVERDRILREAQDMKTAIVNEAREAAQREASRLTLDAQKQIEVQKQAALADIKNETASLALSIAEKILRSELQNKSAQDALAKELLNKLNVN